SMLTRVLPPARPAATLGLATKLFIADYRHPSRPDRTGEAVEGAVGQLDALVTDRQPAIGIIADSHPLADDAGPGQTEYDKAPISETSAPDAQRSNRMDFTIGLNIGDD